MIIEQLIINPIAILLVTYIPTSLHFHFLQNPSNFHRIEAHFLQIFFFSNGSYSRIFPQHKICHPSIHVAREIWLSDSATRLQFSIASENFTYYVNHTYRTLWFFIIINFSLFFQVTFLFVEDPVRSSHEKGVTRLDKTCFLARVEISELASSRFFFSFLSFFSRGIINSLHCLLLWIQFSANSRHLQLLLNLLINRTKFYRT